jgi:ABC-type lipoprotein export system ATPase subunit
MLTLKNVEKYFYRHKSNEIHVVNNTSLEFGEKGLTALLGPSGCGKTTLLNLIGGLDKVNKGKIYVNGKCITGRPSFYVDRIRNLNVGYIFQNYNLIDSMTVFDNVAMVLRMVGIRNKEEIRRKVEYALDLVGMYRYRKRYCDMLSGGERQRVGIARAIVKNPSIIIADEPTGNLDSANTLEVMNIIKKYSDISKGSMDHRYGVLDTMMNELSTVTSEVQEDLGIATWLEGLTLAIAKYKVARDIQRNERVEYQTGLVKNCRTALEENYRKLTNSVNAYAITFGEEEYTSFIEHINAMIKVEKAVLKSRATRSEAKKEETDAFKPSQDGEANTPETPQEGDSTTSQPSGGSEGANKEDTE